MVILNLFIVGPLILFAFIFTDGDGNWAEKRFTLSRQTTPSFLLVCLGLYILTPIGFLFYLTKIAFDCLLIFKLKKSHIKYFIAYQLLLVCFLKYFHKGSFTFLENLGLGYQLLSVIGFSIDRVENASLEATQLSFFESLRGMLVPSYYIAGPIEKVQKIANRLVHPAKLDFNMAVVLMASGVIKLSLKSFFGDHNLNFGTLYAVLFSSVYFFLDLSAYSDLIQGLSKFIGLDLSYNFNLPFLRSSVSSLWRNWHISLYNWFTEYVFEPLVYSKKMRALSPLMRYSLGVMVSFLLIGMWHRIGLNYLIWGASATTFVILEQMFFAEGHKPTRGLSPLGILYVLVTMGTLRYITMAPDLTLSQFSIEARNFMNTHVFHPNWTEEWLLVGQLIFTILLLSFNDFLILRKSQRLTKVGWTLLYVLIASVFYFSMYSSGDQTFSYGRI